MAQAFYDSADDATRDWLANLLFYRELETIRRDKPLLDPTAYPVWTIPLYNRDLANHSDGASSSLNLRGGASPSLLLPLFRQKALPLSSWFLSRLLAKPATVQVIDDDDDDEDDDSAAQKQPAGTDLTTKLDIPGIRHRIGYSESFVNQFPDEDAAIKLGDPDSTDQDTMYEGRDWVHYLASYRGKRVLFKGFPMVENVVFIKHPNHWSRIQDHGKLIEDGQCYWVALALLLYGNASYWIRVKAEHLNFLEEVLKNPRHHRHAFYARENQVSTQTKATGPADQAEILVNLWEKLLIPGCWANDDLSHLTADMYGIFLVVYKYNEDPKKNFDWKDKVYDIKTFGAYNNRHVFLCYAHGNHYQPMIPNEFLASEFKLPRITLQNTKGYKLSGSARKPAAIQIQGDDEEDLVITGSSPAPARATRTTRASSAAAPQPPAPHHPPAQHQPPAPPQPQPKTTIHIIDSSSSDDDDVVITGSQPAPAPASSSSSAPAAQPQPQTFTGPAFFRTASKSLLNGIKVARLKAWCQRLRLGSARTVEGWTKAQCVDALLAAKVTVRMRRLAGAGERACGVETALIGRVKSGTGGATSSALHITDEGTEHRDRGGDDGD
ncbi:hypothetical protein NEMBOFW57_010595 [Staphylotrichum longicolle]|uniref:OTU domain-containing protein n=1 Tax=Staphylotrichum longicolle TaxID=669026 RepID=A0AAD4EN27_9PEZI|nr:hypothetical protein NEMBOFW57_010595 [Staphylotrichum longicolle]